MVVRLQGRGEPRERAAGEGLPWQRYLKCGVFPLQVPFVYACVQAKLDGQRQKIKLREGTLD